jgi:hypothetical protein
MNESTKDLLLVIHPFILLIQLKHKLPNRGKCLTVFTQLIKLKQNGPLRLLERRLRHLLLPH